MSGLSTRTRAALAVVGTALALHGLVLVLLPAGAGPGWQGGVRPAIQVRQVVLRPPADPPSEPAEATAIPPKPRPLAPAVMPGPPAEPAASTVDPVEAAPPIAPEAGSQPLPTFATRIPPGAVLRFELRRAGLSGEAEMVWRPRPDGYRLVMTASALGLPLFGWLSEGVFDADGLAPERFVDRRRARELRAASFERATGRIRYSGPAVEYPLLPGSQDRLSWLVQLPAIIAAAPQDFPPGARIPLFVTGARGDADVWSFVVESVEAVETAGGRLDAALHLRREPRKRFDTRVDVWLDPARHHLPVRLQLTAAHSGESNLFVLQDMVFP